MLVYHGSYLKIDNIDLSKCKLNKDFGQGFYVTKFRHHAENWAQIIGLRNNTVGFVTEFDYCDSPFTEQLCKVRHFAEYDGEWLDFVIANRTPKSPMHDFDIVEGPVADDKVQHRIFDYFDNKVDRQTFLRELKYHEETHQICFCTMKSLLTLSHVDEKPVSDFAKTIDYIIHKLKYDDGMDEVKAVELLYNSKTFAKFSDESAGLYLKPWREIYAMLKNE